MCTPPIRLIHRIPQTAASSSLPRPARVDSKRARGGTRLRTFRVLCGVVLLIATLALVGGTPASATTYCQYQPYEKDTALVGFQTYIETRQQGNFFTSGSSNCWGQGTYAHTELTSSGTSYCYGHITPLIFSVHISSCAYSLSGTSWYYDGYKERYKS